MVEQVLAFMALLAGGLALLHAYDAWRGQGRTRMAALVAFLACGLVAGSCLLARAEVQEITWR
jgi:hypothetical protein